MKRFLLVALIVLPVLVINSAAGPIEKVPFDYQAQIGLATTIDEAGFCMAIANATLTAGSKVYLISAYKPQSVFTATLVRKLEAACSSTMESPEDSFYEVKADRKLKADDFAPKFAVVNPPTSLTAMRGLVSADLDQDGVKESFRICTSHEGMHLTVWSGQPLRGTRRWHSYFYLGYDVEPSCSSKDG